MKKNTKILIICLAVLLIAGIIIIVISNNKSYTNKYSSIELYDAVLDSFSTDDEMNVLDDDIILEFVEEDWPYLEDYIVAKDKNAKNINEIGIFKVQKGKAKDMKALVEEYVSNLQKSYRAMDYFPEEVAKIDCATVKIFGNYVVYSFLNEKDSEAFYNDIEDTLKE